jgi:hypothetical protein
MFYSQAHMMVAPGRMKINRRIQGGEVSRIQVKSVEVPEFYVLYVGQVATKESYLTNLKAFLSFVREPTGNPDLQANENLRLQYSRRL